MINAWNEIARLVEPALNQLGVRMYSGFANSQSVPPYVVLRPLNVGSFTSSINTVTSWQSTFNLYCVAGNVADSYKLAVLVLKTINEYSSPTFLVSTSISYSGLQVEKQYETLVTVDVISPDR